MPLRVHVGLSRTFGEPHPGARGANVNFEVELESSLLREPDQLREKIRYLFRLARSAVEEELKVPDPHPQNGQGTAPNGQKARENRGKNHFATPSQVQTIHGMAARQQVDLAAELRGRFGVDAPEALSIRQASAMIDALKPSGAA